MIKILIIDLDQPQLVLLTPTYMPNQTERQQTADALQSAFLANLMAVPPLLKMMLHNSMQDSMNQCVGQCTSRYMALFLAMPMRVQMGLLALSLVRSVAGMWTNAQANVSRNNG